MKPVCNCCFFTKSPTKSPKVKTPRGYRKLRVGERLIKGDIFLLKDNSYSMKNGAYFVSSGIGMLVFSFDDAFYYRKKKRK